MSITAEREACAHRPRPAIAVANEILHAARASGASIDPMKLQKLAFYAHGWHLGLVGSPLLDEQVEAWRYGPVIPSIYHAFKQYGTDPISAPASAVNGDGSLYKPILPDGYDRALVERIWNQYGRYSAVQLSKMTHDEGTPWSETWQGNQYGLRSLAIPNEVIATYFAREAAKNRGNVVSL